MSRIEKHVEGLNLNDALQKHQNICDWLSPIDSITLQNDIHSRINETTGLWLLESKEFLDWVDGTRKLLWCHGIRKSYEIDV
jgi:hypothetical protein